MAVGSTVDIREGLEGYKYGEVEEGLQPFSISTEVTGGVGADVVQCHFLPSSTGEAFRPWVAITRAAVFYDTAAPTSSGVRVYTNTTGYERSQQPGGSTNIQIATVQMIEYDTNKWSGDWYGFVNLGRVRKGTNGQITAENAEVNTGVMNVRIEGFLSDHAILSRWWLGA